MFKGLGNLAGMLKQAQQMGSRLQETERNAARPPGRRGRRGGMVTVEVNGLGEVLACRIDPSVASDRELIEDLIPGGRQRGPGRAKQLHAEAMQVDGRRHGLARSGRDAGARYHRIRRRGPSRNGRIGRGSEAILQRSIGRWFCARNGVTGRVAL